MAICGYFDHAPGDPSNTDNSKFDSMIFDCRVTNVPTKITITASEVYKAKQTATKVYEGDVDVQDVYDSEISASE